MITRRIKFIIVPFESIAYISDRHFDCLLCRNDISPSFSNEAQLSMRNTLIRDDRKFQPNISYFCLIQSACLSISTGWIDISHCFYSFYMDNLYLYFLIVRRWKRTQCHRKSWPNPIISFSSTMLLGTSRNCPKKIVIVERVKGRIDVAYGQWGDR